jgi:anti-sigma factor RsiW
MQRMDHAEAARKFAAEQYLLGELSDAEREEFEEHFFQCPECAAAVEAGGALVANAREVLAEESALARPAAVEKKGWWWSWTGWRLVPAAALAGWAVAAVLAGYQLFHQPSFLQPSTAGQMVFAPAVSVRAARAQQSLIFSKREPAIAFEIAHEWEQSYAVYEAQIERAANHQVVFTSTIAGEAETANPLTVSLRTGLLKPGAYTLTVYGLESATSRTPLERISFTLME